MDKVPDCDVASHRELVAGSYPDYFLCEADRLQLTRCCDGGRPENSHPWAGNSPSADRHPYLTIRPDPVINTPSRSANRSFLRGIDAGGRRVSMPGLRRVVSSASDLPRPGESCIPASASMGSEYSRSHDRDLPSMRAGVDDPFAQIGGAVHRAARPALSASSATSEASTCAPE